MLPKKVKRGELSIFYAVHIYHTRSISIDAPDTPIINDEKIKFEIEFAVVGGCTRFVSRRT